MKRLIYLFLAVCVFGILCSLTDYKKDERFQTTFPLEEEVITAALEKVGLPGIISETETASHSEGRIEYFVRSPTETHDGANNDDISRNEFLASIYSANYEGKRLLLTTFDQRVVSDQFEWEDWKRQIVFATLLYGGFENEEDVYRAFLKKELPDGIATFRREAQLSGGYCTVSYFTSTNTTENEHGWPIRERSASMRVYIFESYEFYQKLRADINL